MAQVKFVAVSGGESIKVRVERGNEVYDPGDGLLYEERTITVEDARVGIVEAIEAGKRLALAEQFTEAESGGQEADDGDS